MANLPPEVIGVFDAFFDCCQHGSCCLVLLGFWLNCLVDCEHWTDDEENIPLDFGKFFIFLPRFWTTVQVPVEELSLEESSSRLWVIVEEFPDGLGVEDVFQRVFGEALLEGLWEVSLPCFS